MNNRQTKIIFGVVIIILLGIIAYLALSDRQAPSSLTVTPAANSTLPEDDKVVTDTAEPADIEAREEVAPKQDWLLYRDANGGFEMMMPKDTVHTGPGRYVVGSSTFASGDLKFTVDTKDHVLYEEKNGKMTKTPLAFKDFYFMDFERVREGTMAGKPAAIFEAPRGYCDGPGCSDPFIAYAIETAPAKYMILVFYGDTKLSADEQRVLESFKLIK